MRKIFTFIPLLFCFILFFSNCKKTDNFKSAPLTDYLNLQVGKNIIYRLDSTKFDNLNINVISYHAKDEIDGPINDNLGRPGWRVVRYLTDTTDTQPWVPIESYMIIPTRETVEVIENNFRYQKLKLPVKEGYNWKGNTYISLYSSDPNWDYRYLDDWDYTYQDVDAPYNLPGNVLVDSSLTVNQRDEVIGNPGDMNSYSEKNFSIEVYGKGIGLVYKDFLHQEYQPPNGGLPGYRLGYGIRLTMISHN